jgi:hypothetical protein
MPHPRHVALAAALAFACGRGAPTPPPGELRSALAMPTITGATYDPATTEGVTLVTFWSPG